MSPRFLSIHQLDGRWAIIDSSRNKLLWMNVESEIMCKRITGIFNESEENKPRGVTEEKTNEDTIGDPAVGAGSMIAKLQSIG